MGLAGVDPVGATGCEFRTLAIRSRIDLAGTIAVVLEDLEDLANEQADRLVVLGV